MLGIIRAFYTNTIAGETVEGGSTITQQLVKNLFLSSKRIMSRKVEEAILASEMEHYYSKEEILTMYLNTVYYGHNYYGIYEASHGYFGTSPSRLTLAQKCTPRSIPMHHPIWIRIRNYERGQRRDKNSVLGTNGRPRHDYTSGSGLCIPTRIRACGRVM